MAGIGDILNARRIFVDRREGRGRLGRNGPKMEDNIKVDVREIGGPWTGLIWLIVGTS